MLSFAVCNQQAVFYAATQCRCTRYQLLGPLVVQCHALCGLLFQLLVEILHTFQLLIIAWLAVCKCHRLHILFFEHIAACAVVIHSQNFAEVVRVILHRPTLRGMFAECQVEAVIITLDA